MAAMAAHVDFHPEIVECTGPRVEKQIERLTSLENCVCVADHFSPEFQNKFLADYAADQGKHHSSLEDAMTACRLDPSAGGVTKEAVDKFTVRKGTILMNSGPPESSWFKTKPTINQLLRKKRIKQVSWSAHTLLNPGVGPGALKNAALESQDTSDARFFSGRLPGSGGAPAVGAAQFRKFCASQFALVESNAHGGLQAVYEELTPAERDRVQIHSIMTITRTEQSGPGVVHSDSFDGTTALFALSSSKAGTRIWPKAQLQKYGNFGMEVLQFPLTTPVEQFLRELNNGISPDSAGQQRPAALRYASGEGAPEGAELGPERPWTPNSLVILPPSACHAVRAFDNDDEGPARWFCRVNIEFLPAAPDDDDYDVGAVGFEAPFHFYNAKPWFSQDLRTKIACLVAEHCWGDTAFLAAVRVAKREEQVELVIDIGSSSTKLGWRVRGSPGNFAVTRFGYDIVNGSANICPVFADPDTMPGALLHFAREHLELPSVVWEIGWSLSGQVNPDDGSVISSFILNKMAATGKTYDGYQLSVKLQEVLPDGAPRCKAANDGVAAGVGIMALAREDRYALPCLSLCLGTGPAITVIDTDQIFTTENKWHCTVGMTGGPQSLFNALGSDAVQGMAEDRFSQRIKRALPGLLNRYLQQFNWQPKSIVISGGLANRVSQEIVAEGLTKAAGAPSDSPLPVMYVLQDVEQEQLQICGAALYSKRSDSITVAEVAL